MRRLEILASRLHKNVEREKRLLGPRPNQDDLATIYFEAGEKQRDITNEMMLLRHGRLIREAKKLFVPLPEFDPKEGSWLMSQDGQERWHLSQDAQRNLLADVRKEKAARGEQIRLWLPGLTGLVGALIGLAGLILHGSGH